MSLHTAESDGWMGPGTDIALGTKLYILLRVQGMKKQILKRTHLGRCNAPHFSISIAPITWSH